MNPLTKKQIKTEECNNNYNCKFKLLKDKINN